MLTEFLSHPIAMTRAVAVALVLMAFPMSRPHGGLVASTPPAAGRFSVRGSTIYGPDRHPFVARGVNVNGYQWVWRRPVVPDVGLIADCWHFNAVRVNSFLFKGRQRWPQYDDNDDLDAIVKAFTARRIVVIIEAHDRIGSYFEGEDLTRLAKWYEDLARLYRNDPYVWFDLQNEPGGDGPPDVSQWVGSHARLIAAIREGAQASNIILVEGATWGQDAGTGPAPVPAWRSAILGHAQELLRGPHGPWPDVAFSIHTYERWNGGDARLADFLDRAAAHNVAIVVGEYGAAGGDSSSTRAATESLFRVAPPRGVGRLAWQWTGDPPNVLTDGTRNGGGWEIDSCRSPGNLSWMGRLAWDDTHAADGPAASHGLRGKP